MSSHAIANFAMFKVWRRSHQCESGSVGGSTYGRDGSFRSGGIIGWRQQIDSDVSSDRPGRSEESCFVVGIEAHLRK